MIAVEFDYIEEIDEFVTNIDVYHFHDLGGSIYKMYIDEGLSKLEQHALVKSIYELYKEYPLNEFFEHLKVLSVGFASGHLQTEEHIRKELNDRVKKLITDLKSAIQQAG